MIKTSIAFLAGMTVSTVIVVLAGGRPAAFVGLGFVLSVAIAAGVLRLVGIPRLVRFLNALSHSAEPVSSTRSNPRRPQPVDMSGYRKPSRKQQLQVMNDSIDEYRASKETDEFFADPELFAQKGKVA